MQTTQQAARLVGVIIQMKRFMLFAGDRHYPLGGWSDFRGSYGTCDEASDAASQYRATDTDGRWWHVVDLETGHRCAEYELD